MGNIINYLKGVRHELSLVVWPKKEEVIRLTLIVFLISGLVAAYVGGLDYLLLQLMQNFVLR